VTKMRYPMIAARLFETPLLAKPTYVRTVAHALSARMGGFDVEDEKFELKEREPYSSSLDDDGILTIPIVGGLYNRGDHMEALSGMQSYTNLGNTLAEALVSSDVRAILLDIDSPGGEAAGCLSFAECLIKARKVKPIWGVASGGAYSAAYKIAAACDRFYAPKDVEVGSIGVVWLHLDQSNAMHQAGLAATFVYAGKHKVEGNSFEALNPEARANIQARIDERYEQFVNFVAANRPMTVEQVRETEARDYLGPQASEMGLTDGVASYEDVRQMLAEEVKSKFTTVKYFDGTARIIQT